MARSRASTPATQECPEAPLHRPAILPDLLVETELGDQLLQGSTLLVHALDAPELSRAFPFQKTRASGGPISPKQVSDRRVFRCPRYQRCRVGIPSAPLNLVASLRRRFAPPTRHQRASPQWGSPLATPPEDAGSETGMISGLLVCAGRFQPGVEGLDASKTQPAKSRPWRMLR